jgi:hypothetical protein
MFLREAQPMSAFVSARCIFKRLSDIPLLVIFYVLGMSFV